jgi:RNA polymerase sigma-70 factor (ECF subfamily)
LPPHYRAAIELRHFQELSYAEIASALDIPLSDVKSHLFRGRKILAQRLKNDD